MGVGARVTMTMVDFGSFNCGGPCEHLSDPQAFGGAAAATSDVGAGAAWDASHTRTHNNGSTESFIVSLYCNSHLHANMPRRASPRWQMSYTHTPLYLLRCLRLIPMALPKAFYRFRNRIFLHCVKVTKLGKRRLGIIPSLEEMMKAPHTLASSPK